MLYVPAASYSFVCVCACTIALFFLYSESRNVYNQFLSSVFDLHSVCPSLVSKGRKDLNIQTCKKKGYVSSGKVVLFHSI